MTSLKIRGFAALAVVSAGLVLSATSPAQTGKAKPKPLATPPVKALTDADIISRAGDYDQTPSNVTTAPLTATTAGSTPIKQPNANKGTARRELDARVKRLESSQTSDYETRQK